MAFLSGPVGFIGASEIAPDGELLLSLLDVVAIGQSNFHEMARKVRFAEKLGVDLIEFRMGNDDIDDLRHPMHMAFLETLRDPILIADVVDLGDVAQWRALALESELPSDALAPGYSCAELNDAIRDAWRNAEVRVALCAAGRIRFPDDLELLGREAQALYELGFRCEARARLAESAARGGDAIAIG